MSLDDHLLLLAELHVCSSRVAQKLYPNKLKINSCTKLMKLRGPDYQGFKEFYLGKFKTLFCASRLSIIDINDRSNQPIEDEEGILTFNGEIYNYL